MKNEFSNYNSQYVYRMAWLRHDRCPTLCLFMVAIQGTNYTHSPSLLNVALHYLLHASSSCHCTKRNPEFHSSSSFVSIMSKSDVCSWRKRESNPRLHYLRMIECLKNRSHKPLLFLRVWLFVSQRFKPPSR